MGVEVTTYSQFRDSVMDRAGLFGHAQRLDGRRRRHRCAHSRAAMAGLGRHWNRSIGCSVRSVRNCGMHLAVVSGCEALHPRVGQPNQEAA
jgi:hypothetical protein